LVHAQLGAGHVTGSGNVKVTAESHTDADAFANNVSAGLLNLQKLTSVATSNPTVTAIVAGGFVQAGTDASPGTLTVEAKHGKAPPPLSDGTITGVDQNADTLSFSADVGIKTGQSVVYSPNGSPIAGLVNGHTYNVIVDCSSNCTSLQLGDVFTASGCREMS